MGGAATPRSLSSDQELGNRRVAPPPTLTQPPRRSGVPSFASFGGIFPCHSRPTEMNGPHSQRKEPAMTTKDSTRLRELACKYAEYACKVCDMVRDLTGHPEGKRT